MVPHAPNNSQTAGRHLPAYPLSPWLGYCGPADCLFTRWFTAA